MKFSYVILIGILATLCIWLGQPTSVEAQAAAGFVYKNITTSVCTVAKSAPGTLHTVVVNTAGTSWTMQIFDNTACSGTVIAGNVAFTIVAGTYVYDAQANVGISLLTAGATPGDLTVTVR